MSLPREPSRPLLLPQNRRVRHLQGIYLRNLSFERSRVKTADDADLHKGSTHKLDTGTNVHMLHHAASSESLRERPAGARRRSTNLANKSPVTRQRHLELAIESRAADVFFSLHVDGVEDPVYVSEVGTRSINFDFLFFDLTRADPHISRSAEITVKVWAKRRGEWLFFLEQPVQLRQLKFIGTLANQHYPPNCLVFHLTDGIYALELPERATEPKQGPAQPTSSYNALMKLSNLEASIQDAIATQEIITAQINEILDRTPPDTVPEEQEKVKLANNYLAAQTRTNKAAENRRDQLKASIAARRSFILEGRAAERKTAEHVEHASQRLPESRASIDAAEVEIRGQRRRICEELSNIFPITPSPTGAPLSFQICGLGLPNTDYDPTSSTASEDALSAALGYVAQLTHMLQFYLCTPLPYPVQPYGSRSSVRDDISHIADTQRSFPLFLRGGATAQYRFDYGWFLLNKDIERLCAGAGLRVVDVRHTLPNLKYLLYVCSAGRDELPARKRGGVRGLYAGKLKGRVHAAPDEDAASGAGVEGGSRRGSAESEAPGSKQRDELRRALQAQAQGGSGGGGGAESATAAAAVAASAKSGTAPVHLPFDEGTQVTLRTKGMREHVH